MITISPNIGLFMYKNFCNQILKRNLFHNSFSKYPRIIDRSQNFIKETFHFLLRSIKLLDRVQKVSDNNTSQLIIKEHKVNTYHPGIKWIIEKQFFKTIGAYRLIQSSVLGYGYIHKWNFVLHKYLRLNITFQYISIYIYHDSSCYLGHVVVKSFSRNTNASKVQYCGTQSLLVAYPAYRNVEIILAFSIHVSYEILLSYSVIDLNRVVSINEMNSSQFTERQYTLLKPNWILFIVKTNIYIYNFQLTVNKFQNLIITLMNYFNQRQYIVEIYDGPGTLSKKLKSEIINDRVKQEMYLTSSFHCVLFLYHINPTDLLILNKLILYFARNVIFSKTLNLLPCTSLIQTYPSKECNAWKQVCLITVKTGEGYKINITMYNLTHNYERNSLCKIGGLTVYNILQKTDEEISTVCVSHTGVYKYRNIYSTTPTILIVIYVYIPHGKLNVTLGISTTKCKVVPRHACKRWNFAFADRNCVIYQIAHHVKLYQDFDNFLLWKNKSMKYYSLDI